MSPTSESTNWYYAQDGESIGPVSFDTLIHMFESGELTPDTPIIEEGKIEWHSLAAIRPYTSDSTVSPPASNPHPKLIKPKRLKLRIRRENDDLPKEGNNPDYAPRDENTKQLTGLQRFQAERQRQLELGYTTSHDLDYSDTEILLRAAECYEQAFINFVYHNKRTKGVPIDWPWDAQCWKPNYEKPERMLEKAGGLMLAYRELLLAYDNEREANKTMGIIREMASDLDLYMSGEDLPQEKQGCNPLTFAVVVIIGFFMLFSPLWIPIALGLLMAAFMWLYAIISVIFDMFK